MKTIKLFLITQVICFSLLAQTGFFVDLSGNYSLIPEVKGTFTPNIWPPYSGYTGIIQTHKLIERYETKPGLEFLAGHRWSFYKNLSVETGLGFSLVRFKRDVFLDLDSQNPGSFINPGGVTGIPIGFIYPYGTDSLIPRQDTIRFVPYPTSAATVKEGQTIIMYLNLPVKLYYPVLDGKLYVGAGITGSILAWSRQTRTRLAKGINDLRTIEEYHDTSSNGLNNFLLSGDLTIQYSIFKKLWLNSSYQHNFSPVYDPEQRIAGKAMYRQIKIGLRYFL